MSTAVKYEYEINVSAESSDCPQCGNDGDTVTLETLEEGIKALDVAIRSRRKAGIAGRNLDTKLRIESQRRTLEKMRKELRDEYMQISAFEK